jgi:very-short-patch-repair endonuclease
MVRSSEIVAEGTDLERTFDYYWNLLAPDLPQPVKELRFDSAREWRFDRCWIPERVVVECEGNQHWRQVERYHRDIEKYNQASAQGWTLLRCTTRLMRDDPEGFIALVRTTLERTNLK